MQVLAGINGNSKNVGYGNTALTLTHFRLYIQTFRGHVLYFVFF